MYFVKKIKIVDTDMIRLQMRKRIKQIYEKPEQITYFSNLQNTYFTLSYFIYMWHG